MKLSYKLILLNIVTSAVLATILVGITTHNLSEEMGRQAQNSQEKSMKVAWHVLHENGNDFKVVGGQMLNGTHVINNDFATVDTIKEMVGSAATIFMDDTRISTNVKKPDGSRAVGTQLAPGPVYDTVLKNGKPYRGKADILGVPYFTAYDPIVSASGQVVGILFVGVEKAEFFDIVERLLFRNVGYTLLVLLLSSAGAYYLTSILLRPLLQLDNSMSKLSGGGGDLTMRIQVDNPEDEIGKVATSFNRFMDGLQAIIRELLDQTAHISGSANELASIADRVSEGSRRQNATVADLASSMDNMAGSIGVVSQSAGQAEVISRDAGQHARQGEGVVQEASAEINRIADSVTQIAQTVSALGQRSNEISGIVQVSREIRLEKNSNR